MEELVAVLKIIHGDLQSIGGVLLLWMFIFLFKDMNGRYELEKIKDKIEDIAKVKRGGSA